MTALLRRVGLALLIAAAALPAVAQPAPAAAPAAAPAPTAPQTAPTPEAIAAARELVKLSDTREQLRKSMAQTLADTRSGKALGAFVDQDPQMRMQRARNPAAWEAALARLGAKQAVQLELMMTELVPLIDERSVQTYATHFSVDELRQLTAFNRSPLGRMVMERVPAVMADAMAFLQSEMPRRRKAMLEALAPDIERELQPLLTK